MPDGRRPVPGGWNRILLLVEDLKGKRSSANILQPAAKTMFAENSNRFDDPRPSVA